MQSDRIRIISTADALEVLIRDLRTLGWFAFDTEFVGEDRYQPEVCLIQVSTDDVDALIDPLTPLDATPLWELVADPTIEKLVHAGSEDLSLCQLQIGKPAANVVDLQIAAGIAGLGYPINLARLCRVTTGERLHKSQTLTDWRRRPLNQEQIEYAAEDVRHLPGARRHLYTQLAKLGRWQWLQEECAELCRETAKQKAEPTQISRLKGAGSLRGRELNIAEALLIERNALAQQLDRPPRVVLKDHLLIELARRGWTDVERMRTLRGLSVSTTGLKRFAAAIEEAKKLPPPANADLDTEGDSNDEEMLLSLLTAVLRDYCNRSTLSYSILATKDDLRKVVRPYTRGDAKGESPLEKGWRRDAVGSLLVDIIEGRRKLAVNRSGDGYGLSMIE